MAIIRLQLLFVIAGDVLQGCLALVFALGQSGGGAISTVNRKDALAESTSHFYVIYSSIYYLFTYYIHSVRVFAYYYHCNCCQLLVVSIYFILIIIIIIITFYYLFYYFIVRLLFLLQFICYYFIFNMAIRIYRK